MRNWDTAKLDALFVSMAASVGEGLKEEERLKTPDHESSAMVEGFWLYRLAECQDGPIPPVVTASIDGPLFA